MQTDIIKIDNMGNGLKEAIAETEAAARFSGLDSKEALRLQMLTEEMMGMVRSITGEMTGDFWIDSDGRAFTLHVSTKTKMDAMKRYQFISSSTENKNEAAKGFVGFLRDKFESAMLAEENIVYYDSNGEMLDEAPEDKEWDRYERSILRKLADKIVIGVRGGKVEMTVLKQF